MFWFALVGLFTSSYLLNTYTTGIDLRCGVLHGCDIVRASKWSSWFGIPTPLFGVLFYLFLVAATLFRTYSPHYKSRFVRLGMFALAAAGFVESAVLTSIQKFSIGAWCTWCLVSAFAATMIFIASLRDGAAEIGAEKVTREFKVISGSFAAFVLLGAGLFYYLIQPQIPAQTQLPLITPQTPELNTPTATTTAPEAKLIEPWTAVEGPTDAKVTLVEFMDFECPGCGVYYKLVIKPLREKYQNKIQFAVRHFPLPEVHPDAVRAAVAGVCVQEQNRFFRFYDIVFQNQSDLSAAALEKYATQAGANLDAYKKCVSNPKALETALKDREEGIYFGVTGTPTLIINNQIIDGTPDLDSMSRLIDERLK